MDATTFYLILNVLLWPLCLGIILLILLQGGAGDMSSAFGGGGQLDTTLGVGASKKMAKLTGWLIVGLFIIVTILAIPRKGGGFAKEAAQGAASKPVPETPVTSTGAATQAVISGAATAPSTAAGAVIAPATTQAAVIEAPPVVEAVAPKPATTAAPVVPDAGSSSAAKP